MFHYTIKKMYIRIYKVVIFMIELIYIYDSYKEREKKSYIQYLTFFSIIK
jgi:hypothetical protein